MVRLNCKKEDELRALLLFPPSWYANIIPMLAIPTISGCLRHFGHETFSMDLNADFMNYIFTKPFFEKVETLYKKLEAEMMEFKKLDNISIDSLLQAAKFKVVYYMRLQTIINQNANIRNYFKNPEDYLNFFKNENSFYNSSLLNGTLNQIMQITNNVFTLNASSFDEETNSELDIFKEYYDSIIDKIIEINPDYIGFSICSDLQYYWSKYFSRMLKKRTNAHISFGGSEIASRKLDLEKDYIFFKTFADSIIYGDAEVPIVKLADYIDGKISIDEVPGLTYMDNGKIKSNPTPKKTFERLFPACYDGFDMDKYFINKLILPIESSRGCYYGKCDFCNFKEGAILKQKTAEDIVEEIKELQKKYNVDTFFFTDSAIHPKFAEKFSECIIKNNLKINYLSFVRLEDEFTKELLQQMYESGMRLCMWGFESGSDRILNLYHKGTNSKTNLRILKDAHSVGLFNYLCCIIGFPKETIVDLNQTEEFLIKNSDCIDYVTIHRYTLLKNSPIADYPEKFGLTEDDFKFEGTYKNYSPKDISNNVLSDIASRINKHYFEKIRYLPNDQSCLLSYIVKNKHAKFIN